jgi:hypothetical protein
MMVLYPGCYARLPDGGNKHVHEKNKVGQEGQQESQGAPQREASILSQHSAGYCDLSGEQSLNPGGADGGNEQGSEENA